jgi:hypothetical protein
MLYFFFCFFWDAKFREFMKLAHHQLVTLIGNSLILNLSKPGSLIHDTLTL